MSLITTKTKYDIKIRQLYKKDSSSSNFKNPNFLQIEMENGNIKEESFYMSGDTLIIQSISNGVVKKNKFIKESLVL